MLEALEPSALQPAVPPDLDTICLKCLHKEPGRRYLRADELADDLRRFVAGEPIHARPVGAVERTWKWVKRRPGVAVLIAAVVVSLLGGIGASTGFALKARNRAEFAMLQEAAATRSAIAEKAAAQTAQLKEREALQSANLAKEQTRLAVRNAYNSDVSLAYQLWRAGEVHSVKQLLARCPAELRLWEWHYLDHLSNAARHTLLPRAGRVLALAYAPDGSRLAMITDSDVVLYDTEPPKEVLRLPLGVEVLWEVGLVFRADGRELAVADGHSVRMISVPEGKQTVALTKDKFPGKAYAGAVAYGPGRRLLAAIGS